MPEERRAAVCRAALLFYTLNVWHFYFLSIVPTMQADKVSSRQCLNFYYKLKL